MTILVCGSRDWIDPRPIETALFWLPGDPPGEMTLLHGDARGADRVAAGVARALGWTVRAFPADWRRDGKAAGPLRNQRMLDEGRPDLVLAFPLPSSRGTWDMVRRAKAAGVEVRVWGAESTGTGDEGRR